MRVLICPDAFPGLLTAVQAAEAIASGWRERAPHDELTLAPLSDGGPGFLHVVQEAQGGIAVAVTVSDPLGRDVPAQVLLVDEGGGCRTAYVEAAQAAGLHLLSATERNPMLTSTYGVGQLVAAAIEEGAQRVVIGLGGTATNDGGAGLVAGLLAARHGGDTACLARGGGALADLLDDALGGLPVLRAELGGVELVVATDDNAPLLGFEGTSATSAAAKGASPEQAQQLEAALGRWAEVVGRALPAGPDLLTGLPRRLDREPGAGAGGGLGFALFVLGARREGGVEVVLRGWDFDALLARHDLVVTGEGSFDWTSLRGGVVRGVAEAATRRGLATIVLAGEVHLGRRETMSLGVAGSYAVAEGRAALMAALADPVGILTARAARLAATWSPG